LGQGVAQGTAGGVASDGLRLLSIAGPAARLSRLALTRVFSFAADTSSGAPICTWVATAIAARMTGIRHFARPSDLMEAAGVAPQSGAWASAALELLRSFGARTYLLPPARTIAAVEQLTRRFAASRGVVVFEIWWTQASRRVGHTLVAYIDEVGRFRIIDRTGEVVESLVNLQRIGPGYAGISHASPSLAYVVHDAVPVVGNVLRSLGRAQTTATVFSLFALEVQTIALVTRDHYERELERLRPSAAARER
jgi:hypothetical protein